MTRLRGLFGPVDAGYQASYLSSLRETGSLRTFGHPAADIPFQWDDSWQTLQARFPQGWEPDFIAVWLPYATVPSFVWESPVPIVGLAADWSLNWHAYRSALPLCDLVLTDSPGCEALRQSGLATPVVPAVLYGLGREWFEEAESETVRDVDVAFVGNLNPSVQGDRLAWIAGLADLHPRFRVRVATGVFGPEYRQLMLRTRIAFNRSARGECNQRALEAAVSGALLFQEAGNAETFDLLTPGTECVVYTSPTDLQEKLAYYLTHEEERAIIASRAKAKAASFAWPVLWESLVEKQIAPLVKTEQVRNRLRFPMPLPGRVWARTGQAAPGDPTLDQDLASAGDLRSLGILAPGPAGIPLLARASAADPQDPVLALLLAEAWIAAGDGGAAATHARRGLSLLATSEPSPESGWLDLPPTSPGFSRLRAEWERAAALNPGDRIAEVQAKRAILRWRLHTLLANLTGELADYHEATLARPDLPETRAALGCALARSGRPVDAVEHLRTVLDINPFDGAAARALYQVLADLGAEAGMRQLARARRNLHAIAPGVVAWNSWFEGPAPTGTELVSILVPCCGQVEFTRQCLDSVLAHTRSPYELILINDASPDETAAYFESVQNQAGPERVVVLTNPVNRGFAASINRGLAAARGELLVLLNNDTIVTPGWLEGLAGWATSDWPRVGIVGPVSNGAPAPQFVAPEYGSNLARLDEFARRHRETHRGRSLAFPRATGFCLLVRRAVLDRIGVLDEGFGVGFFEDDDLCVRARRAGYTVLIAQDVFIHHFGGQTFSARGLDTQRLLAENLAKFRAKWGEAEAAPYRPADMGADLDIAAPITVDLPTIVVPGGRPRVSLTMIVRDEEHNLGPCLTGFTPLVDEVIVVDTGSKDRTRELARSFGAKVFEFPWIDDFAAARNEALRHATGDYVFWADADDRIDEPNAEKLKQLLGSLSNQDLSGWVIKCRCPGGKPGTPATVVDHVRVFPLRPEIRWKYRVHEQILPALRAANIPVKWSEVIVDHVGYVDPAVRKRKLGRDTKLLEKELADHPEDPFALFNLGSVYQEVGDVAKAEPLLVESLRRSHPSDSIVRKLYALIAQCRWRANRPVDALAAVAEGRGHYPDDAELLFLEGMFQEASGNIAAAEMALRRLVDGTEGEHFASVDTSLRSVRGRARLGWLLHRKGDFEGARHEWQRATQADPHHVSAWEGLVELALLAQDWVTIEKAALACDPADPSAAAVLRARSLAAQGNLGAARDLLELTIATEPDNLRPRVALSHLLLKSGTDPDAAEAVLREILQLDPANAEARHNLAVLLRSRAESGAPQ